MDNNKQRKTQNELNILDNALREVRGVSLNQNVKLDQGMMGGFVNGSHHDTSQTGAAIAQANSIGAVSFIDPGMITNAGLMQTGASNGSFRLPNITMNSLSSQPKNDYTGAGATHHHLNVTLGEDKFQYTAHNENNQNGQRLPIISNQAGSSARLKAQLSNNDYVGLMSKKKQDGARLGSMDFNVSNSFAIGGTSFQNQQNAKIGDVGLQQQDLFKDPTKLLTIEPQMNIMLQGELGSGKKRSRGGHNRGKSNNVDYNTIQPGLNDYDHVNETPQSQPRGLPPTTFESYIGKVISSVQNRKKNPRLKSLFNQGIHQHSIEPNSQGAEAIRDYGAVSLNKPSLLNNQGGPIAQTYDNQSFSGRGSQVTRAARGPNVNVQLYDESIVSGPMNISQIDLKTPGSIIKESQTTQVSLLGNRQVEQKEPKATEQVAYLLRQIQKKGQMFLPLETVKDQNSNMMFKENPHSPEDFTGMVVFSKNGFVSVAKNKNQITDFISNDQYIEDGVTQQILKEVPFFKKFQRMRFFIQWKTKMRLNSYDRTRRMLAENFIFSKPIFSEKYEKLIPAMNSISSLSLIEIQPNVIYGKKQQSTLEEKCKSVLDQNRQTMEVLLTSVKEQMMELKQEILEDDENFEDEIKQAKVKEMIKNKTHAQPLVMFSKQRMKMEAQDEQYRLQRLRHSQFDQLLFMVFRYWSYKIVDLLFDSKSKFNSVFSNLKMGTQFEISICFGNQILDAEPTMDEHLATFTKVFADMEEAVFENQFLRFFSHDMNDLFFGESSTYTRLIFENMREIIGMNQQYSDDQQQIFARLNEDMQKCQEQIDSYKHLQEIQDFCHNWNQGRKDRAVSLEMGFYDETWSKMGEFTERIKKVPSGNIRHGTILIETNTLKKQLTEMPKTVIESIRRNVTQTMEQETKTLREELGKTSEILDQLPTSLNTYVEQVNTLKYVDHKKKDFADKFDVIMNLDNQCKVDNIKVPAPLVLAIEDVRNLHQALPQLYKTSTEQLAQNKDTMEKIMNSSSNVLSKKIKAFEKKYVETYLHDKSRLDDCGDTLEELFKRSKAIHEIRSKVILYREFLKLLYANDVKSAEKIAENKLSCAEDFETLQDIHKHTIRLWKILLYWKKRRNICYNTPFLNLDTQMIIKSIHKVMKYLDEKLPQHGFVQRQSRSICKIITQQVKETNQIIEFVKDLRKDSLQTRHWQQIFDLIKAPHLKTQNKFTIVDLREYSIQNYNEDIHQIVEHANTEAKYETIFHCLCDEWEQLELKIIPFKDTENSYIMVNTDTLNQAIEENLTTLEIISQSEFAAHIKKDIVAWIQKLKTMHKNLEIWIDAQRYWVNLDIIYNSSIFTNIFGPTTKQFINTRLSFQRIMWSSYKNPKAIYNLMIESRIQVFIEMTTHFQVLQKRVHEFLEAKRLIFSRFYFLNDSQFLEFLTLANTSQDFSMYINTLFVGAQHLYLQPADQVKFNKYEADKKVAKDDNSDISEENDSLLSAEEGPQSIMTGQQSVENSKMGIVGVNDYQVLGMISQNKELFLFETPVEIQNDNPNIKEVEGYEVSGTGTGNVERWLIKVEKSMQETMTKQMQYAVKSFATRALDEWVLDYPQQVIMTTLNLVLTNEINDILEERQRQKELDDAEGSDLEYDKVDGVNEEDNEEVEGAGYDAEKNADGETNRDGNKEEETQVAKKTLRGTAVLRMSPEEAKRRLRADLFGDDFVPDDRFDKAIEMAAEDIRQKKQQNQSGVAAKATKRAQKRPEYRDFVMEVLGQQSFYGIYLRIHFWINKLIRSLTDERKGDWQDKNIDLGLTGVQKMIMKNVVLYLIHQRDIIDKMIALNIHDKNDFEWLSKVKIIWNQPSDLNDATPEGPLVQCGGWQQQLGTEYLGSQQRIPLSPLTDRYYVFVSSALREKSGVLFRCNQSHQHASDVFEEFSMQCHMPFKSFQCNQDMQVTQLMQVINGAAMAKFWVFFEHLDNLPLASFQIIMKEIQMVQQQYIIAELADLDLTVDGTIMGRDIHMSEEKTGARNIMENGISLQKDKIVDNQFKQPQPLHGLPQIKIHRPSLGIFGSISSKIIIKNPSIATNLNLQAQSSFRSISLARPQTDILIKMLLKSEGYKYYMSLSRVITEFISEFILRKNALLHGTDASNSDYVDSVTERLVFRDLRTAVRFSILLRDQEWKGYLEKVFSRQQRAWKFELQLYEKSLIEKQQALEQEEALKEKIHKEKEEIEVETAREGFRAILKTKFFNEWRAVKQQKLTRETNDPLQRINESEAEKELEMLIIDTFNITVQRIRKQDDEIAKQKAIENKLQGGTDHYSQIARAGAARRPKRKITHASTTELNYATKRARDEVKFMDNLEAAFNEVAEAMQLQVNEDQLYHCLGVIEYMRRQKAVAIVGPVCSGKTQILKIVAQTLKSAYDIIFRTSSINPETFTKEEFYGPINAFESQNKQDQDEALKRKSIFQIVLDNYQHEKLSLKPEERNRFVQSFLIDCNQIDTYFMDSLVNFIQQSNIREREYYNDQEFLLHLSSLGQAHDTLIQHLPITLPNGNVVMLPSDLYFFFETESLSNASPLFLSQIGLVITSDTDVTWKDLYEKQFRIYLKTFYGLSEKNPHKLNIEQNYQSCERDFLFPMINELNKNQKIQDWQLWNMKSLVLQYFKILNSMTFRLRVACDKNENIEDEMLFPIKEMKSQVIWSMILNAFVMTFGVCLNTELKKVFEDIFAPFKNMFTFDINSQAVTRPTIFDIFFDLERLTWEVIQEKLEFKLKLGFYPKMSALLVPTPSIALSYFILEQLTYALNHDSQLDKNFRLLGPQGTSKSVILNTFIHRSQEQFNSIIIPMSGYLSFDRMRNVIEKFYVAKRKKLFTPKDENKKIIIMIDDLHLQSNFNINIVEFMRSWTQRNGYFDVGAGFFKRIADFSVIMAQNSSYRVDKCKMEGREPLQNRFLFYTNTQYTDEMPIEQFKPFVQHFLTSKQWSPNKLLQKYYIIITNALMRLLEKVKRTSSMQNSSFSPLFSFDIVSKFCATLVMNTVISDDSREIGLKGQKEEDIVANVVLYEVFRNFADRIYKPQDRIKFVEKAVEIFRHEFQMKEVSLEVIDQMVIGNFHDRKATSYIKYLNVTDKLEKVKDMIEQKIAEKSHNHFLSSILDTPNGIREVFKISRSLFKEQQHLIIVGSPSSNKHELLQISTIMNDVVMLELNAPKYNEPTRFADAFKQALLTVIRLDGVNCFIVINDEQLRDSLYVDYVHNYISYIGKDEECILMDEQFKAQIIAVEQELFYKNKDNFKYDKNKKPNSQQCLQVGVKKMMKNSHVVFLINQIQSYYEWFSLFPGLETKCDVMFLDDLHTDGYKTLTSNFLKRTKIDEDMSETDKDNLIMSMVQAKEITKAKIFENFYNLDSRTKNYSYQPYLNGQGLETVYPNQQMANFSILEDGNFQVYDPLLKQVNYNLRAELNLVMQSRYIMYLEVFRFLYDFLSLNLSIRKNYYEAFINKTTQFNSFFDEINLKKKDLHSASSDINYRMTKIQEKISKINKSVSDKKVAIVKRKAEIEDLELQLKNQQGEVDQVLNEKIKQLKYVLDEIQGLTERDVSYVVTMPEYDNSKQQILNMILMVITKNPKVEFDRSVHDNYFWDPQELHEKLKESMNHEFDDPCFQLLKEFISQYNINDFSKPIFKCLFSYLSELYRKLNVRNTMSVQLGLIKEIKSSIGSNTFSISYSEHYIQEKEAELLTLNDKIVRVVQRDNKLGKKIEVAEISHMRTQHIFESVKEYGQKIKLKLDSINSRSQALLGDCIVLASSICFLGFFSSDERIEIRNEIVKFVSEVQDITCSKDWVTDGKNANLKVQNKMFKSILKEFGLRQIILPHNYSGILTQSLVCETLFHMIFAPSCPLIIDPTGEVQEFIKTKIISPLNAKQVYGSDLSINYQLQNIFKSQSNFGLLNDVNNFEKASFGLTQDQSLLHRLSETFYNGIDFNYDRTVIWKKVTGIEDHIFSSYGCLNKKIPVNEPQMENVSLYQIQMFSSSFDYQNGPLFMAKGSCFTAMSTNEDIFNNSGNVNAWMEIKELMLEQINNHEWKQLQEVKKQRKYYDENKSQLNRTYENNFLVTNHDTLQKISEYTSLKQSIEDIENQQEERVLYKRMYEEMIQKYEILTYYSKVILNMYLSLKMLSKILNEITCSWKIFKQILQQILKQVIRQMAHEVIIGKPKKSGSNAGKARQAGQPQIDIDLKFFQKTLIPQLHKTLVTSVRQDSSAPLFNLIFAMRVALLQDKINQKESNYFFKQLLILKDFNDWRKTEIDFVDMDEQIPKQRLLHVKREVSNLYPKFGKIFIEKIQADLGQEFKYKDASLYIFKLFKEPQFKDLPLIQEICLGFICPDHEFKSKLTQFVYQQLSEVFEFSEEYSRLHQFLSRASWKNPIALLSVSHVNMINTISSIAQHYGVGLDVIRTDYEADMLISEQKRGINVRMDTIVKENLQDLTAVCMKSKEQRYQRLQTMATSYLKTGNVCSDINVPMTKLNYIQNQLRSQFENPDKKISGSKDEDPVELVEQCARRGSWVLVSTIRFPQFWKKICNKLEQMDEEGVIDEQFRIIFDLQGYVQNDISDSFLFDHAVTFHMTEQNTEEFEGFDDIWSAILDERVLIKLGDKIDALKQKLLEETKPDAIEGESQKSVVSDSKSSIGQNGAEPESPSNFKLIDSTIKSDVQRSLYKQFMNESKAANQGLKFDLMRVQVPSEKSVSQNDDNLSQNSKFDGEMLKDKPLDTNISVPQSAMKESDINIEIDQQNFASKVSEKKDEDNQPNYNNIYKELVKPINSPELQESPTLKKDASQTNVTDSTVPIKTTKIIDKNSEEFKQVNQDLKQEGTNNTVRSLDQSIDGQLTQIPLGALSLGQTKYQSQSLVELRDDKQSPIDAGYEMKSEQESPLINYNSAREVEKEKEQYTQVEDKPKSIKAESVKDDKDDQSVTEQTVEVDQGNDKDETQLEKDEIGENDEKLK